MVISIGKDYPVWLKAICEQGRAFEDSLQKVEPQDQSKALTVVQTVSTVDLAMMGFDISRLKFYQWLTTHEKNPELKGVRAFRASAL